MIIEAHDDRYETDGRVGITPKGVVVHTVEGGESLNGIRALMTKPGDRQRAAWSPTNLVYYGASYDAIACDDGTYDTVQLGNNAMGYPYSAPPLNKYWLHIVMPGYSSQLDANPGWRDPFSLGCIRAVARYIADMSKRYGFPIVQTFAAEMKAAGVEDCTGYCGHVDVSYAFGKTDHTDPGKNFPWELLAEEIASLVHTADEPREDDDMTGWITYRDTRFHNVFLIGGAVVHLSPKLAEHYKTLGVQRVEDAHEQTLDSLLHSCGLDRSVLVAA